MSGGIATWLPKLTDDFDAPVATKYAAAAGALIAVYLLTQKLRKPRPGKPLPGPWMTPSSGRALTVKQVDELRKQYGPVFGFRNMSVNIMYLCDVESIRDALVGQPDVFAGRFHSPFIKFITKDCGVILIDGPKWQEHRRFILTVLRNFGFGKNITERSIQDELSILLAELAKSSGKPMNPRLPLVSSVANIISVLVFGERCGNDPDFELMVKTVTTGVPNFPLVNIFASLIFRILVLLPGDKFGLQKVLATQSVLKAFVDRKTDEHLKTIDWDNQRDLIDAYLIEMRKRDKESPNNHTFTDYQLFQVIFELFIAGMETTSTTLIWALFLMAKHPDIQKRVHAEIDTCIGDKPPAVADRTNLVYTTAVIHEVERYVTLVPFSVPHRVTEDTVLRGYFVPANTVVMPYLYGAHHDERVWKGPNRFDPSNFYDESTKSLINLHNLIPFSVGKRSCLGESLAAQELFVFFAGVLQRYKIEAVADHPLEERNAEDLSAPLNSAPDYKVCMRERVCAK